MVRIHALLPAVKLKPIIIAPVKLEDDSVEVGLALVAWSCDTAVLSMGGVHAVYPVSMWASVLELAPIRMSAEHW